MSRGLPLRFSGPNNTGITTFAQGALGAGGYASSIIMASDGSAMAMRNDTGCPFLWLRSTNKWRNAGTQPGISNIITTTTPLEMVFAPSNPNRMYLVYSAPVPIQGAGGGTSIVRNYLYVSNDKGLTWTQNSSTAICGDNPAASSGPASKFCGPRMAVDPKNADVCYIISQAGAVYVTYDGGTTLSVITDLLAALPSAVVNGTAPLPGGTGFTVVSNPIDGLTSQGWFAFDPTWPLACGTNGQDDNITASSGTSMSLQRFQSRDGGTGATSVGLGDTLYFGRTGAICVDGSSDTIANPGGSGVISKYVYVCWMNGASHVWRTTNGGVSWAAMSGGPSNVLCKMKMSNDGTLAGGGFNTNILYVCDQFDAWVWRYVENPPTGSGLSSATWTKVTSGFSSSVLATTSHPTLAGHAAACNIGGGLFVTADFGTTWTTANPGSPAFSIVPGPPGVPPNGTDTPWLQGVADISLGDCEYDMGSGSIPNKIWLADGIGILYTQVTANFTSTITAITKDATGATFTLGANDWIVGMSFIVTGASGMTQANGVRFYVQSTSGGGTTIKTDVDSSTWGTFTGTATASFANTLVSQSEVMDSLTMQKIVKTPSPNGRLLMANQDRQIMSAPNVTTYPTDFYPHGFPSNPMDVTYSKADPMTVWAGISYDVTKSTDGGVTFTDTGLGAGLCNVASLSASNCVAVARPGTNNKRTTNGGTTWTDVLFAGSALDGSSSAPFQGGASYWVVCDDFGNYYYWQQGLFTIISAITKDATGAVFTLTSSLSATANVAVPGQSFTPFSINGMTQANGVAFTITSVVGSNQYKTNVDSSAWSTYTGSGFAPINPTFWKSTDGGANFVLKSTTAFNPSANGAHSDGSTFCCPTGVNGEIWFCPGATGSWIFKVIGYVSTDSGATWTAMNQAGDPQNLYHLAFGAPKPGGTGYPAAYMSGFMTDPSTSGLWRCDDPKNAARVWTPIFGFRTVDPEGDRYLEADRETYGTVYQATYSTGYVYGTIS